MRSFHTNKLVATKYNYDFLGGEVEVPAVVDARSVLPDAEITCSGIRMTAVVPKYVASVLPRHVTTDITGDRSIMEMEVKCPQCNTTVYRKVCTEWSDSLDSQGIIMWSQCVGCKIAFEIQSEPELPTHGLFWERVPNRVEVMDAAKKAWQKGEDFACVCSLRIRMPNVEDSVELVNVRTRDIMKEVNKLR